MYVSCSWNIYSKKLDSITSMPPSIHQFPNFLKAFSVTSEGFWNSVLAYMGKKVWKEMENIQNIDSII